MSILSDKPNRDGYGDIFSGFLIILSIAFSLKMFGNIIEFAELRNHGATIEGYWVSSYTNPGDGEQQVIYYFTIDYRTFNAQQTLNDNVQYTKSGDPVSVIYLPYDPSRSRIAGTEGYSITSVVKLILSDLILIFSVQYFIAYYAKRPAWIFRLIILINRLRGNAPAITQEKEMLHDPAEREKRKKRFLRLLKWGTIAGTSLAIIGGSIQLVERIQEIRLRSKYEARAKQIEDGTTMQAFDGVEMVLVPAGCFDMGNNGEGGKQCFDESFWIDRYEVTNEQYRSIGCMETSSQPNQPRNCVSWSDAVAFCESREARLPTEAEWEYAARGPEKLVYPWGDDFVADNVVHFGNAGEQTATVGSLSRGISWVGAFDMSGNVWEWTSTLYRSYPYNAGDGREIVTEDNQLRVLRGGSFDNTNDFLDAMTRYNDSPGYQDDIRGFRCARSYN
jgi:formylglycine-generating enzyme required for sulfatase activity